MNLLERAWMAPVALIAIAVAGLIPSCGQDDIAPGEAVVTLSGTARVEWADGEVEQVDGRVSLGRGDTIEVMTGSARFELADGVRFAGVAGRAGVRKAGTTVRMGYVPELEAGDLLVTGPEPTRVSSGATTVTTGPGGGAPGEGSALRLSRTLGLRVGVYRGSASIDSAGVRRTIPGLRRMEVPAAGELPRTPRPLRFAGDDRWDRRYLGGAIALDAELFSLIGAVEATGGADRGSAAYLRSVLPATRKETSLAELVRPRRVSTDTLVGAIIAGLADDGSFARRWKDVFGFHDAGATWGLVALDQQVEPAAVTEALRDALNDTEFPFQVAAVALEAAAASIPPGSAVLVTAAASTPPPADSVPTSIPPEPQGSSPPPPGTVPSSIDGAPAPGSPPSTAPPAEAGLPAAPPATVAPAVPAPSPPPDGPEPPPGGSGGGEGGGQDPPGTAPPPTARPTVPPPVPPPPPSSSPITLPPVTLPPPITVPPLTVPPLTVPRITLPPVTLPPPTTPPPLTVPPITLPPVTLPPPTTLPPLTVPPITLPPIVLPAPVLPPLVLPSPLSDVGEGLGETVGGVVGSTEDLLGEVVEGEADDDGLLDPVLGG